MSFVNKLFKKKRSEEKLPSSSPVDKVDGSMSGTGAGMKCNSGNGLCDYQTISSASDCPTLIDAKKQQSDYLQLEEALLIISEEQPRVARSTPRGMVAKQWSVDRDTQHCLYEKPVYDAMIQQSLGTIEMLQENLNCFITEVRNSPSRSSTPQKPENGPQ